MIDRAEHRKLLHQALDRGDKAAVVALTTEYETHDKLLQDKDMAQHPELFGRTKCRK